MSEQDVLLFMPDTLHMFIYVLYEDQEMIDQDIEDIDKNGSSDGDQNTDISYPIFWPAQDIVCNVNKRKKSTPKHVGLGLFLHQVTRPKDLA